MDDAPMLLTDKGKPDTTARHVLQVLAEHADKRGTGARPSLMRIQYRTGYDRRTVQRALRRLEDAKLIEPTSVMNGCTVYRLVMTTKRPAGDWTALEREEDRQREVDAERQRRYRSRSRVTDANAVTVTDAESVTADECHGVSVRTSRTQNPDVTDATPPEPSVEHVSEPSLSPRVPQPPEETPPTRDERETMAAPEHLTPVQQIVRQAAVVPVDEERPFIAWMTVKHPDKGAGWWQTVARNGHLAGHVADWRASKTTAPAAASGIPKWCEHCGDDNPAARFNPRFRRKSDGSLCGDCHPEMVGSTAA
jgi:predicted transcriptional regulator